VSQSRDGVFFRRQAFKELGVLSSSSEKKSKKRGNSLLYLFSLSFTVMRHWFIYKFISLSFFKFSELVSLPYSRMRKKISWGEESQRVFLILNMFILFVFYYIVISLRRERLAFQEKELHTKGLNWLIRSLLVWFLIFENCSVVSLNCRYVFAVLNKELSKGIYNVLNEQPQQYLLIVNNYPKPLFYIW